MSNTHDYGEPWNINLDFDAAPITRTDGTEVLGNCEINEPEIVRIVSCVNACAGIQDPAAAIQAARESLTGIPTGLQLGEKRWELINKALELLK
jgi:hypothetical protein